MPTLLAQKSMTAAQFENLDTELRYFLIRGELCPMPPPAGDEHGSTTSDLSVFLGYFVMQHELGRCYAAETGFVIERNPDTVLAPDWAFINKHRLPATRSKGFVQMVPDAVLEVRSPGNRTRKVDEKIDMWLAAGVRMVLELNLSKRVLTVYRPHKSPYELGVNDTLTGEDVLPGFSLPLRRVL